MVTASTWVFFRVKDPVVIGESGHKKCFRKLDEINSRSLLLPHAHSGSITSQHSPYHRLHAISKLHHHYLSIHLFTSFTGGHGYSSGVQILPMINFTFIGYSDLTTNMKISPRVLQIYLNRLNKYVNNNWATKAKGIWKQDPEANTWAPQGWDWGVEKASQWGTS